ncbi:MAG TPA: MBL fold metallo-hydrolase [Solirubrobacterales bacterium]|nr:MBL fold metallo-hydrolase [Solirubrobacterales bacterium]
MQVEWHGQSAFSLRGESGSVFIDPFGDVASAMASRDIVFEYPPIEVDEIDLLLVTHEHLDHNAVEVIGGEPVTLRATAGRHESPLGEVLGIASEHDAAAGTERGPNTIFAFELDGLRVAHFGDFGQSALRPEQAAALGEVDLLILPVGGGPTIGAEQAAAIVREVTPRWVVPMHYRTPRIGFLETEEEFLGLLDRVERCAGPRFETADLPASDGPVAVVPAAP